LHQTEALVGKGVEYLFDKGKPHFASWLRLYDIDTKPDASSIFPMFISFDEPEAAPLYYAALCGFHDVAKQIINKYPQDVDARGGYYVTPLVAALAGRHFKMAQLLCNHGADPNVRCYDERTPLHATVQSGNLEMIQKLIEYNADINARNRIGWTPLHIASRLVQPNIDVVQLLLEHGVDVNAQAKDGSTALHEALAYGTLEVVHLLLKHGANVNLKDRNGKTPHQTVSGTRRDKLRKLEILKTFTAPFNTAQGSSTINRSTTKHGQRSSRRKMYLQHVSSSSILDRSDPSDTDLGSDISLSASNNSG
jgi:ankyrin repeat protein